MKIILVLIRVLILAILSSKLLVTNVNKTEYLITFFYRNIEDIF